MNSFIKFIVYIGLISVGFQAISQDFVVKKNGDDFSAKILEVGPNFVKYKLTLPNDTTTVNSLLKSEIFYIKYASGFKEIFDNEKSVAAPVPAPTTNPTNTTTPAPNNYKYQYQAPQNTRVYQDPSLLPINYDGRKYYQNYYRISETQVKFMLERTRNSQISDLLKEGISVRKGGSVLRVFPTLPLLPLGAILLLASSTDGSDGPTLAAVGGIMMVGGIGCLIGGNAMRTSGNNKISKALGIYNNTLPRQ